ncbi:hypothetical protein [Pseudactinotalea sp. Z1748]|uniref:hypothetical protein n=1 Tax=Pseudactinotalea sp. Z1748 TaxID=3413027 RepID=UPI003C7CF804
MTPEVAPPGTNRKQWARCRNKVNKGQVRCHQCAMALVQHADVDVRRMLVQEQGLAEDVLEVLLVDPDFLVSEYANTAMGSDFSATQEG